MFRKRLAAFLAVAMTITSIPFPSVYAAEEMPITAEQNLIEDDPDEAVWIAEEAVSDEEADDLEEEVSETGEAQEDADLILEVSTESIQEDTELFLLGEEVEEAADIIALYEEEQGENQYWYRNGDCWVLPGWDFFVDNWFNAFNAQEGMEQRIDVTSITFESAEDDQGEGPVVEITEDREDGWNLQAKRFGHAKVILGFQTIEGEDASYEFQVYVGGDVYNLNIWNDSSASNMLPGDVMNLHSSLHHMWYQDNEEGDSYGDRYEEDVEVSWQLWDGDEAYAELSVSQEDPFEASVTAKESTMDQEVHVNVSVSRDGEEITANTYTIFVCGGYYDLQPLVLQENLYVGTEAVYDPKLYFHEYGQGTTLINEGTRYYFRYWDENAVEIYDAEGKKLTGEDPYGVAPFTLKRLKSYQNNIDLVAERKDGEEDFHEVAAINLELTQIDYPVEFSRYEEDSVLNLARDQYQFTVSCPEYVPEDMTIRYLLIANERGTDNIVEVISSDDSDILTADGMQGSVSISGLQEFYERHDYNIDVALKAELIYNGNVFAEGWGGFWFDRPEYNYQYPLSSIDEGTMLPDWERDIESTMWCDYRNFYQPRNLNVEIPVTNVEVIESRIWDDEQQMMVTAPEDYTVLEVNPTENGWRIRACDCGTAVLKVTYEAVEGDPNPGTYEREINVSGDSNRLIYNYRNNTNCMLPDSEAYIDVERIDHEFFHGEDHRGYEAVEDVTLEIVSDDEGRPCYNENLIQASVEVNEETGKPCLKVVSNKEEFNYGTGILVRASYTDENGNRQEAYAEIWVQVSEDYYVFFSDELTEEQRHPYPGTELDLNQLNPYILHVTEEREEVVDTVYWRVEYDPNNWTIREEEGRIPVFTRTRISDDSINLIAFIEREETDSTWLEEVARGEFWFNRPEVSISYDLGEAAWDDYGFSVYNTEDYTIHLNVPEVNADIRVDWEVGIRADNEEDIFDTSYDLSQCYTIEEQSHTVTIHGGELYLVLENAKEDYNDNVHMQIRARLECGEGDNAESLGEAYAGAWSSITNFNVENAGDLQDEQRVRLVGEEIWIPETISARVDNQLTREERWINDIPIKSISLGDSYVYDEELERYVAAPEGYEVASFVEDEDGKRFVAKNSGYVMATIKFDSLEEDIYHIDRWSFEIYVSEQRNDLWYAYPNDSDMMLRNEEMIVTFNGIYHEWKNSYGDIEGEAIDQFTVELVTWENGSLYHGNELIDAVMETDEESGKPVMRISSKEKRDRDALVRVKVSYVDGRGLEQEFESDIHVYIAGGYTMIFPLQLEQDERIMPGQSVDLNQCDLYVIERNEEGEYRLDDSRLHWIVDYDPDQWDCDESQERPVLTRKTLGGTWLCLIAEMEDENGNRYEVGQKQYNFDGIWIDLRYDIDFDWDGYNLNVFEDEDYVLSLRKEELNDAFRVEWVVGIKDEDDVSVESGVDGCYTVNEDGTSITIHGAALKEVLDACNQNSFLDHWMEIRAAVYIDGSDEPITDIWAGVHVQDEYYYYEYPYYDFTIVNGWVNGIGTEMPVRYHNKENRYENWDSVKITNVTILSETVYDPEEDQEITAPSGSVVSLSGNAQDGWKLTAKGLGRAVIQMEYETVAGDPNPGEFLMNAEVVGDLYEVMYLIADGSSAMLPNTEKVIRIPGIWHSWYASEEDKGSRLLDNVSYVSIDGEYDANRFTARVEKDPEEGWILKVKSTGYFGSTGIPIRVIAYDENGEQCEAWTEIWINTSDCYTTIQPDGIESLALGESKVIDPVVTEVYLRDGEEVEREVENVSYYAIWSADRLRITDADGKVVERWDETIKAPFTITRLSKEMVDFQVIANVSEEDGIREVAREGYIMNATEECVHSKVSYNWTADSKTCTAVLECEYDEEHNITEVVTTTKTSAQEATCLKDGYEEYKAVFTNPVFTAQTKKNILKKLTPAVTLTAASLKMKIGQSTTKFKVTSMTKGDSLVKVVSSKTDIVKVASVKANGTFKLTAGKKTGKAVITLTFASGLTKTVNITVQKTAVAPTGIKVPSKSISLKVKKTYTIKPELAPVTCLEKITYKSSAPGIAKVDAKGKVTAVKKGTAKITVKAGKKSVVITVKVS